MEKKYRKNKNQIELETFNVKTLAHEIELGIMKHEWNMKTRAGVTEARVGSLVQQLSSGIHELELRMNSLKSTMNSDYHNLNSDVSQKIKKLENQQDQVL